jgi:hypothetical protein
MNRHRILNPPPLGMHAPNSVEPGVGPDSPPGNWSFLTVLRMMVVGKP